MNKPVLLHYGIEYLSAFLLNLHFNITEQNKRLNQIGDKLYKHCIDPFDFKKVTINTPSKDFLEFLHNVKGEIVRFFSILNNNLPFKSSYNEHREEATKQKKSGLITWPEVLQYDKTSIVIDELTYQELA